MTVKHEQVTVLLVAKSLLGTTVDAEGGDYALTARTAVLTNTGAVDLFIGGPGVTTTSYGLKLVAGASTTLPLSAGDVPYGVTASTTTVNVLHLGV